MAAFQARLLSVQSCVTLHLSGVIVEWDPKVMINLVPLLGFKIVYFIELISWLWAKISSFIVALGSEKCGWCFSYRGVMPGLVLGFNIHLLPPLARRTFSKIFMGFWISDWFVRVFSFHFFDTTGTRIHLVIDHQTMGEGDGKWGSRESNLGMAWENPPISTMLAP